LEGNKEMGGRKEERIEDRNWEGTERGNM